MVKVLVSFLIALTLLTSCGSSQDGEYAREYDRFVADHELRIVCFKGYHRLACVQLNEKDYARFLEKYDISPE